VYPPAFSYDYGGESSKSQLETSTALPGPFGPITPEGYEQPIAEIITMDTALISSTNSENEKHLGTASPYHSEEEMNSAHQPNLQTGVINNGAATTNTMPDFPPPFSYTIVDSVVPETKARLEIRSMLAPPHPPSRPPYPPGGGPRPPDREPEPPKRPPYPPRL